MESGLHFILFHRFNCSSHRPLLSSNQFYGACPDSDWDQSSFLGIDCLCVGQYTGRSSWTKADYFSITHFAKKGNCSTAISGIFSCQLFNFLIGFGVSLFIQSLDGEYEFLIFDFKGSTYDKISDSIILLVMAGVFVYLATIFIIVIKKEGFLKKLEALSARIYYVSFVIIACLLAILTDFFK